MRSLKRRPYPDVDDCLINTAPVETGAPTKETGMAPKEEMFLEEEELYAALSALAAEEAVDLADLYTIECRLNYGSPPPVDDIPF